MTDALRNAESISQGVRSALAIATGTATTVEEANAVAKASAVAPTGALSVAENLLLSPIVLVTLAIIGLIAVLYYLYNNNEMVRNGINYLIGQIQEFIQIVIATGQQIASFVAGAIASFVNWTDTASAVVSTLIRNIVSAFTSLPSQVNTALGGLTGIITKPFTDAYAQVKPILDKFQQGIEWGKELIGWSGVEFAGVGYAGLDTLNSAISESTSNNSSVTNNFNINGIIEESASEYIIESVNNHIKKQNLIRGV